jgi:hypothetical protein
LTQLRAAWIIMVLKLFNEDGEFDKVEMARRDLAEAMSKFTVPTSGIYNINGGTITYSGPINPNMQTIIRNLNGT